MHALFTLVRDCWILDMVSYDDVAEANRRVSEELRGGFDQFPKGTQMWLTIYDGDRAVSSKTWISSGMPARC